MIDVCDLAEDLSVVIVEYQVRTDIEKCTSNSPLIHLTALTAEGDLRPKLYIDCKSLDSRFEESWLLIEICRMQVGHISAFDRYRLTVQ